MRAREVAGWVAFAALSAAALVVAATAPRPPQPDALDARRREDAFVTFVREEGNMRRQAARDWPADEWSQDDAFHNLEHQRAWNLAGAMKTSEAEVLRALDDGMREGWPRYGAQMRTTVPPCRPRPITD